MHIVCVLKLKGHTQEAPAGTAKGVIVPEKGKHDKHAALQARCASPNIIMAHV